MHYFTNVGRRMLLLGCFERELFLHEFHDGGFSQFNELMRTMRVRSIAATAAVATLVDRGGGIIGHPTRRMRTGCTHRHKQTLLHTLAPAHTAPALMHHSAADLITTLVLGVVWGRRVDLTM